MDRLGFWTRCNFRGCEGFLECIKFSAAGDRNVRARAVFAVDGDFGDAIEDIVAG